MFIFKAMFLVYCALEKEPVPMSLPPALVPPSKRTMVSISGSVWSVPSSAAKDSYHSLPPVGILPTKAPLRQVEKFVSVKGFYFNKVHECDW